MLRQTRDLGESRAPTHGGELIEESKETQLYLNTKSSWQSKELTKTGPRMPDLETMPSMRMIMHSCV